MSQCIQNFDEANIKMAFWTSFNTFHFFFFLTENACSSLWNKMGPTVRTTQHRAIYVLVYKMHFCCGKCFKMKIFSPTLASVLLFLASTVKWYVTAVSSHLKSQPAEAAGKAVQPDGAHRACGTPLDWIHNPPVSTELPYLWASAQTSGVT